MPLNARFFPHRNLRAQLPAQAQLVLAARRGRVLPTITRQARAGVAGGHVCLGYRRVGKGMFILDDVLAPVVQDAGFTEVAPGSQTAAVVRLGRPPHLR